MKFAHATSRLTVVVGEADSDGCIRVALIGEFDYDETRQVTEAVSGVVDRCVPTHVTLDATKLTFLDSAGIRALLECRALTDKVGAGLSVEGVTPIVFQVLRVTELVDYLAVTTVRSGGVRDAPTSSRRGG
ncbi:STAS domain-containing protein [Actinoplanes sp. CA-252034]|uniref:STAS domain-containing protein n=1 Tax=Actinoplanes sp. CA-252034 TaxID=3239906 RepID=UPI003D95974F